ncbi:hypothetical protein F4604DRAFT_1926275 [Suillus subluteus]|nr:hypothetical protein F4604DRAFT_1926275 [Suillus subluteus]
MASYKQFSDAFQHPPHTAKITLTQLKRIKSTCDARDVEAFFAACEPDHLSGVVNLFWHDWLSTDPNQVSMLKQVTGRAQWDIQHYLVAVIMNAAPPGVVIAVHALMDFHYLSQAVTIDGTQCQKILDALRTFHDHKHEIIAHGGHRGAKSKNILDNWYIPKLEMMQSVVPSIYQMHTATVGYRDDLGDGVNDDEEADEAGDLQATISDFWGTECVVSNFFKQAELASLSTTAPRPLRMFVIGSTAIHLNFNPSLQHQAIDDVAKKFCLPDLQAALADYIQWEGQTVHNLHKLTGQHRASPTTDLPFKHLNIWFKVRVQQMPHHSGSALLPALTVNASPLDANWKYSCYDAAIFTVNSAK